MNKCTIFAGGEPVSAECVDFSFVNGSYVISADRGYELAQSLGICSDLAIGDFDSVKERPCGDNVKVFPVKKDDTDLMLAVRAGIDKGCDKFVFYGAAGGRLDHMLGNIQALKFLLDNGAAGRIVSDKETMDLLSPGSYEFPPKKGFSFSLLSYSESVEGLSITGTKYTAQNITITNGFPIGISNEIKNDAFAQVKFTKGTLLVIQSLLE
ncbi:MAG: thiamine diphosphokinase [Ruminococcus sp.]|nr:thiamine diphosphokinase [Ruminococcus sp.]